MYTMYTMYKLTLLLVPALLAVHQTSGNKLSADYDYSSDNYEYGDYGDSDDDDAYDGEDKDSSKSDKEAAVFVNPVILTESKNIIVDVGTTIRLECIVDQLPDAISLIWKRPDAATNQILAIGEYIQVPEIKSRANVESDENGSILTIGVATVDDAGTYQCDLGIPGKKSSGSLKHTVSIRVAPTITKHSQTYIETEKGQMVTMECRATGSPVPTVKWTRLGKGTMPDGKAELIGEMFTIRNVNRHHAGEYRCSADNGFSKGATKDIDLRVLYKPEIVVEEVFVHTKTGNEAELVCNVHGFPHPTVEWKKNGEPIQQSSKVKINNIHSKHSLTIKSVEKEDFGKYSCHATSAKGSSFETLEISGLARAAEFKSKPGGMEEKSYVLEWSVVSYSPVTAFRVETRQDGVTAWAEASATPIPDGPYHYAGKLFLKDIEEATRFESRVSSRNDEGWSSPSPTFHFATKGAEPKQEGVTSGSSSTLAIYLSIILALLLVI